MRLLDQVRDVIRKKHYSIGTEHAYVDWIKRCSGITESQGCIHYNDLYPCYK